MSEEDNAEVETSGDEPTSGETDERARGSALPVAIALLVVAAVAAGVGIWLITAPPETPEEANDSRRQDAIVSAERFANVLTSYDATKDTDAYADELTDLLADGTDSPCWSTVAGFVPAVADEATAQAAEQRKQLYEGEVRERAVETVDPDSARVILAVDFATSAEMKGKRVPLLAQPLRFRVDLEADGDDWLVSNCTLVAAGAGEDDGGDQ
ncbi:hypothetical protein [Solicola gregarius]|uniref:Mce-associated membrane protein n=1 Tax=Solicola gregarius TaxID=2908642 RepID=A0AA46TEG1_9ACTN|nr:hypothetical protein [Solicola gregarius]UYM03730.1 hypothetical protein L0C25_14400 [Solicola gregarius]